MVTVLCEVVLNKGCFSGVCVSVHQISYFSLVNGLHVVAQIFQCSSETPNGHTKSPNEKKHKVVLSKLQRVFAATAAI